MALRYTLRQRRQSIQVAEAYSEAGSIAAASERVNVSSPSISAAVAAFEEEFGIEIPDDAAETIQTFGDAVKFITENADA